MGWDVPITALQRHSISVYEAMMQSSKEEPVGDEVFIVYRGSVVNLFKNLSIGFSYYTPVFRLLEDSGCVTKLQQGARGVDTIYVLHRPPTEEDEPVESSSRPLTRPTEFDTLTQRVENLERRLGGIDIVRALAELQESVDRLSNGSQTKPNRRGKADKA
jgi:hypothetical protein